LVVRKLRKIVVTKTSSVIITSNFSNRSSIRDQVYMEKMRLDVVIPFPSSVRRFVECFKLDFAFLFEPFVDELSQNFPHGRPFQNSWSSFTSPFHTTFVFKILGFDIRKRVDLQQRTIYFGNTNLLIYEC
jgi:hypothetical protein